MSDRFRWHDRQVRPSSAQGECDETRALLGQIEPARLEHAQAQKMLRQREAGPDLVAARRFQDRVAAQERRQRQQPVLIRLAGFGAHRAPAFRRHVDEVARLRRSRRSGRDRGRSRARPAPPARSARTAPAPGRARRDARPAPSRVIERRVRVALGQKAQGSGRGAEAVERQRRAEETGRAQLARLDREAAEMLVEPRPPFACTLLPGCRTGCSRRERPPWTRPRWRPCARVISSRMTPDSPCLRAPSTRPSSDHCIVVPSGTGRSMKPKLPSGVYPRQAWP